MRQKLRDKEERGDTFDPICLSNIESDRVWISEKEDDYLPIDDSWMDIHESFTIEKELKPIKERHVFV